MNFFIDTEFLEGTQKKFLGGTSLPTIDLISIAVLAEDGKSYYAVSSEFNLREAWDRWEQRTGEGDRNNTEPKLYWIRQNVLKPIFQQWQGISSLNNSYEFNYKNFEMFLSSYGKTRHEIASEVEDFVRGYTWAEDANFIAPNFYGYYADYDWVAFCWLYGKMKDLPKGFPMYCRDLKQSFDEMKPLPEELKNQCNISVNAPSWKDHYEYPKEKNAHHALADAEWNLELYQFIQKYR